MKVKVLYFDNNDPYFVEFLRERIPVGKTVEWELD